MYVRNNINTYLHHHELYCVPCSPLPVGVCMYMCTYIHVYACTYVLGEEVVELEHLEGQLRTLMDKFKHQRRELKQTKDDTKVWKEKGGRKRGGERGVGRME